MSLNGTLNVGKSALLATQAAIQTVGNNIANAGDPGYTRQIARITPGVGQQVAPGIFLGSGVDLAAIERQVDAALLQRTRAGISDAESAGVAYTWLQQVEAVFNELTDDDLSSALSEFFNAWGDLANRPADIGLRSVVIQTGAALARRLNDMHRRLDELSDAAEQRLESYAAQANDLAQQIADINKQIVRAESGHNPSANGLRDRRDALLAELSQVVNVHVLDQPSGAVDVYVGSAPLVLGETSRGISLQLHDIDGRTVREAHITANGAPLGARGGAIAGIESARRQVTQTGDALDALAAGLIHEINKLHSTGQGLAGYDQLRSAYAATDTVAPLTSPDAGLPFPIRGGSFVLQLRDKVTGNVTPTLIAIESGSTSLDDLAAALNAVDGVAASVDNGRLVLGATSATQELLFAEDSAGVLAGLGIGGFFTGTGAHDIRTADALSDPRRLAASRNGSDNDNGTARLIAELETRPLAALNGMTLSRTYESLVFDVAAAGSAARTDLDAAVAIRETLEGQRQALSGVSMDEEAVSLLRYQRSYQGAARLIAAIDEMMRTVLQLV